MKKSRRSFIKKLSGGLIVASAAPNLLCSQNDKHIFELEYRRRKFSVNDNIQIAAIGMGIQGFSNCGQATKVPGSKLVATCDLYDGRLQRSKEVFGDHLFTTRDYKEILARDDVDAVIISVPDHWHDHISIEALNSGKAVYCEKPMVHHPSEGHAVIEAQKKAKRPLQVGSQRVSSIITWKAKELFEQGVIGELNLVESWYDRQSALGAWQYSIPPDASQETIDWERFVGDAPKRPFDKVRFFRWRNYQDYGTGMAGDLFVHLFSAIHTILSSKGPNRVYASGGLRYWKDGRDVPDVFLGIYDYPKTDSHPAFNLQLRCNFVDGGGGGSKVRFIGSEGILEVNGGGLKLTRHKMPANPGYGGWDSFRTFNEKMQKEYVEWYHAHYPDPHPTVKEPAEVVYRAPEGYSAHYDHHANFIDSIRNGTPVYEDAVFGLRAAGPPLASNMSYFENKIVNWDPEAMRVV